MRAAYPSSPFIPATSPIQARAPPTRVTIVRCRRARARAPPRRAQDPHGCQHDLDGVLDGDAQPPWLVVVHLGGAGAVEGGAGSPPVASEPQDRHGHERRGHEPPAVGVAADQPPAVEQEEGPGFGAIPREQRQQDQGPRVAPGEVLIDGPQREGRGPRCRVALEHQPHEARTAIGREHEEARGQPAGHRTGEAAPEPVGADEGEEPAGPGDDEPHRRGQIADRRQRGGHEHRQGLPRRPAGRVEVEVGDLSPPHEPGPRVVREGHREQERERRDRHAATDQEAGAPAVGHAGRARTVTAPSTVTSTR